MTVFALTFYRFLPLPFAILWMLRVVDENKMDQLDRNMFRPLSLTVNLKPPAYGSNNASVDLAMWSCARKEAPAAGRPSSPSPVTLPSCHPATAAETRADLPCCSAVSNQWTDIQSAVRCYPREWMRSARFAARLNRSRARTQERTSLSWSA